MKIKKKLPPAAIVHVLVGHTRSFSSAGLLVQVYVNSVVVNSVPVKSVDGFLQKR